MIVTDLDAMVFERRPVLTKPPYDCINDHANCPSCKASGCTTPPDENLFSYKSPCPNHGVCGSRAQLVVVSQVGGKLYAVELVVYCADYLPITREWWRKRDLPGDTNGNLGGVIIYHREDERGEGCHILGKPCAGDCSYLLAEEIYKTNGGVRNPEHDVRQQPEQLWKALEDELRRRVREVV